MSYSIIRPRRGTLYEWTTVNPVLENGEFVVEYPETGIGTGMCKVKIGDGVNKYTDLGYAFDGEAAQSIWGGNVSEFHIIQIRAGSTEEWELMDPVLEINELTYDTTKKAFKVGDGRHHWSEIEYFGVLDNIEGDLDFGYEDEIMSGSLPTGIMGAGINDIMENLDENNSEE